MPPYPGVAQVMEISPNSNSLIASTATTNVDESWRVEYAKYLAEKETGQKLAANQQANQNENEPTWEEQYAAYCAEKEAKLQILEERQRKDSHANHTSLP